MNGHRRNLRFSTANWRVDWVDLPAHSARAVAPRVVIYVIDLFRGLPVFAYWHPANMGIRPAQWFTARVRPRSRSDVSRGTRSYWELQAPAGLLRPSIPARIAYLAYEVPANTYVYSGRNANATLASTSTGRAFIAPPGATVYFGDYVFVGNRTVDFRRNIDAARSGARLLLPRDAVLEPAEPTTVAHAPPLLCTP
jgi:hypothetical protein